MNNDDIRALHVSEAIPTGFRLLTVREAESLVSLASRRGVNGPFRLMNGYVDSAGNFVRSYKFDLFRQRHTVPATYIGHKLARRSSGEDDFNFEEEDYLIALAYACEADDVDDEVEGLVKRAGTKILCKKWSHYKGGRTLAHHCAFWRSKKALGRVLRQLEESCDRGERQQINYDLADFEDVLPRYLFYAANAAHVPQYEDFKTTTQLLLRHAAKVSAVPAAAVNNLLSAWFRGTTALGYALLFSDADASIALLDVSKEIFEDSELMQESTSVSPTWLSARTAHTHYASNSRDTTTHLHLALKMMSEQKDAASSAPTKVDKILNFPGAEELNLTALKDGIDENTPFHIAVVHCAGEDNKNTYVLLKLLQYTSASLKCELDKRRRNSSDDHVLPHDDLAVNVQNKQGETALHLASRRGFAEGCRVLLDHGASILVRDQAGRYALTDALCVKDNGASTAEVLVQACYKDYRAKDPTVAAAVIRRSDDMSSLANAKFDFDLTPLHVAAAIASDDCTRELLQSGAFLTAKSEDGRTPLHMAMAQEFDDDFCLRFLGAAERFGMASFPNKQVDKINWINMRDYFGQTALHLAILKCAPGVRVKCEVVKGLMQKGAWVDLQDSDGDTPLHLATSKGHANIVYVLLSREHQHLCTDREKWIAMCNCAGETALHVAIKKGHRKIAKQLIQESKDPDNLLLLRDAQNRTALQTCDVEKDNEALTMISESLKSCRDEVIKLFLLWDMLEAATPGSMLHTHMKKLADEYSQELSPISSNQQGHIPSLLERVVRKHDLVMARELINRGANITTLDDASRIWISRSFCRNISDQPALQDTLGRAELVLAVAALLLNPYTGTPISIGVFGDWGTGKSSFMLQVEAALLCMAVKQTFKMTSDSHSQLDFLGSQPSMLDFSPSAALLRRKVTKALHAAMSEEDISRYSITEENVIETFPIKMHSRYTGSLLKELALVDRSKLVEFAARTHEWRRLVMLLFSRVYQAFTSLAMSKLGHGCGQGSSNRRNLTSSEQLKQDPELFIGHTPAVLIVRYNAWHYDDKTEAAAGLAVNISRELEDSMTPSQWLRMCFMYSWQSQRIDVFVKLFLPLLVFSCVAPLALAVWRVAPVRVEYKFLTLPLGIFGMIWAFFKAFLHVIQPVTSTIVTYIKSPDHRSMLGYQQRVIDDLSFLIDQLSTKPNFMWTCLGYLGQLFVSNSFHFKGTTIGKQHLARRNSLRIVVFIDDLDRCEEKTILEVLRAINLILAACGINVVIGVDKGMVERAITRELLKDTSGKVLELLDEQLTSVADEKLASHTNLLAKRYLQKIIQLPIEVPEPSSEDLKRFLKRQIGMVNLHEEKAKYKNNTIDTNVKTSQTPGNQSLRSSSCAQKEDEVMENTNNTTNSNICLSSCSEIYEENQGGWKEDARDSSPKPSIVLHLTDDVEELVTNKENVIDVKDATEEGKGHMPNVATQDVNSSTNVSIHGQSSNMAIHKDRKERTHIDTQQSNNQSKSIDTMDPHKTGEPVQIENHLLLTKYSPMEEQLILKLSESAKRDGKVPREWKRFLNYHRLCWSILSQDHNMEQMEFKGWRIKLILWIFMCWNWTENINKIIEEWEHLLIDYSDRHVHIWRSPTLGDLISLYIKKHCSNNKNNESPKESQEMTPKTDSWIELDRILKEQKDLSMRFLSIFQKFRFYCNLKVLEIEQKYLVVGEGDHTERDNLTSFLRLRYGE